jgi:carotenoid cleavage dioxygenase
MQCNRRTFLGHAALSGALVAVTGDGLTFADPPADKPGNLFLEGNFAPVREETTADNLKVIGKLPAEMDGMYVRNGPNPQFPPIGNYHIFEGDGMLHGVRVRNGKASYRNRYIRTEGWKEEKAAGKAVYPSVMDPIDVKKLFSGKKPFKNTGNTALVWHHGKLLALLEVAEPHEIKVPDLDTVGPYTFGGKLKHPFTAHPKVDPGTGEMLCFGYQPAIKPYVHYSVVNAKGEIVRTVPIDVPRSIMMHDFAVTPNYSVFMDLPETFSLERMLKGESAVKFEPEHGARFGILPRHGKREDMKWFEVGVCFVFHTLNAWEEGDEVVLVASRMKEFPAVLDFKPPHPTDARRKPVTEDVAAVPYRWRFNLKTGAVKEGPLDDLRSEFPRINESLTGKRTRYGYFARIGGDFFEGLIKYDFEKGTSEQHPFGKGRYGGEGLFVPKPGGKAEDDGWLVACVHDQAEGRSEVVVIDARDFRAAPVARILIPTRVPYGFHAAWLPGNVL